MVKRFIAGAVCPRCGSQDSVRAERDPERRLLRRECVECDFSDVLYDAPLDELPTRVTAPDPMDQVTSQPIRILDPTTLHDASKPSTKK